MIEHGAGPHTNPEAASDSVNQSPSQTSVLHLTVVPPMLLSAVPSADLDRAELVAASHEPLDDQTWPLPLVEAGAPRLLGKPEQQSIAIEAGAAANVVDDGNAFVVEADEIDTIAARPKHQKLRQDDLFKDAILSHITSTSSDAAPKTSASPPEPSTLDNGTASALTEISLGIGPGGLRLPHCSDLADLLRLPSSQFVSSSTP